MIRLTLRSLLAYLDDVSDLTQEQRAELQTQIEASDFARELVHRLRDASNRSRLPAPDLLGIGPADDPNTVAEYLENALPAESVAEFERICLESDTMLAEVSACHHMLKELLENPEQIAAADRERVEAIVLRALDGGDNATEERLRIEASHAAAAVNGSPNGAPDAEAIRETPDYLKQTDWTSRALLVVGAAAVVVLGALTFRLLAPERVAKVDDSPAPNPQAIGDDPAAQPISVAKDDVSAEPSAEPEGDNANPDEVAAGVEDDPIAEPQSEEAIEPVTPSAGDEDVASEELEGVTSEPPADSPQPVAEPEPMAEADGTPAASDTATEPAPATDEPAEVLRVGVFEGPPTAVAAMRDAEENWSRLLVGAELKPGTRVASFPAYRSRWRLGDQVDLELIGEAVVQIEAGRLDPSRPRVIVDQGRLTLTAPKNATTSVAVEVEVSGTVAEVEIDANASVSIEVLRPYTPGFNTLAGSPALTVSGWAPAGGVSWASPSATVQAQKPKRWALDEMGGFIELSAYSSDPGWIEPQGQDVNAQRAAAQLGASLNSAEPLLPQFVEAAAAADLPEVGFLAARCASSLGVPDELVAMLNNPNFYEDDVAQSIGYLREAISRSPQAAEAVRRVLVEFHGDRVAIDLYLMLGGFNDEQVGLSLTKQKTGAVAQMLDWLQETETPLAVSRLAIANLDELLDEPVSAVIDPVQDSPFARRRSAEKLDKRLQRGSLEFAGGPPNAR